MGQIINPEPTINPKINGSPLYLFERPANYEQNPKLDMSNFNALIFHYR